MPMPFKDAELKYYASDEDDKAAKVLQPSGQKSLLYVFQEYTVSAPGGTTIAVGLDDRVQILLAPRAYYFLLVAPGIHKISVVAPSGGESGMLGTSKVVDALAGRTYFYSTMVRNEVSILGFGSRNIIKLDAIDEKSGQELLATYRLSSTVPTSGFFKP